MLCGLWWYISCVGPRHQRDIRRLLSGDCLLSELVLTQALWRADESDIRRIAESFTPAPSKTRAHAAIASAATAGTVAVAAAAAGGGGIATSPLKAFQRGSPLKKKQKKRKRTPQKTAQKGSKPRGARRTSDLSPVRGGLAGTGVSNTPQVALAARLVSRDPDRRFILGERIPFVLLQVCAAQYSLGRTTLRVVVLVLRAVLSLLVCFIVFVVFHVSDSCLRCVSWCCLAQTGSGKTQSDASEDPLVAVCTDAQPDVSLYFHKKLIVRTCLCSLTPEGGWR